MRSKTMGMAVLAMVAVATSAGAGEPAAKTTARPRIELAPAVRVTGFRRAPGQTGAYTGGALALAVDVENTGSSPAEGVVVKVTSGGQTLAATITIPARSSRAVLLTDGEGLASSCKPKPYSLSLSGPGTGDAKRDARVTPTCTFTSTLDETWNQKSPDRVEAMQTDHVYLSSPSIVTAPTCGKGPTMKVRIVSKTTATSPSLIVQAKEWTAGGKVKAQTSAAFPLASRESKDLVLTPVTGGDGEVPARMHLDIVDWTKSLGGRDSDGGIFVDTTRSCALDFGME